MAFSVATVYFFIKLIGSTDAWNIYALYHMKADHCFIGIIIDFKCYEQ